MGSNWSIGDSVLMQRRIPVLSEWQALEQAAQRTCGVSTSGDIKTYLEVYLCDLL